VNEPTRVLLDVDTGIDDALALLYATATSQLDVAGVSAVVGNVPVEVGARNAAMVLAAVGKGSVPVAAGAAASTEGRGHRNGPTNHGPDGLGGVRVRPAGEVREPRTDALALFDELTSDRPVTVAACAPLTNVAQYASRPGLERIVLVGGELVVEDEPEFNVGQDPAAAVAVLEAGLPTTVYPVDLFETVVVAPGLVARLQNAPAPAAQLAGELLEIRRRRMLGDAGALVFLTHPELFEVTRSRMTVVDRRLVPVGHSQAGFAVDVVMAADGPAVVEAFVDAVERCC
jgi:inosine-uridine nucleoside N-ribohydrolase